MQELFVRSLIVVALSAAMLGSPSAAETVRERQPFIQQTTAKTLDEISECFGRSWERRSGQTAYYPVPNGFTMKLSYFISTSQVLAAIVDVLDQGAVRSVTVRAQKGEEGDKLRGEVMKCAP